MDIESKLFPKKLPKEKKVLQEKFFQKEDVVEIAQNLLGKFLFTQFNGILTGGIITETEAYKGPEDKASHAYNNRRTKRTEAMFGPGGTAYVYLCYGIHHLFNIVTNKTQIPHAVLIRALFPTHGIDEMLFRRKKIKKDKSLTVGPGSLSQALGIQTKHTGISLQGPEIWLEERNLKIEQNKIIKTPRIGIDYAKEHAKLPWRFLLAINNFIS